MGEIFKQLPNIQHLKLYLKSNNLGNYKENFKLLL